MGEKIVSMRLDEDDIKSFRDYAKKNDITQLKAFKTLCNRIGFDESDKKSDIYINEINGLKEQLELYKSQVNALMEEQDTLQMILELELGEKKKKIESLERELLQYINSGL